MGWNDLVFCLRAVSYLDGVVRGGIPERYASTYAMLEDVWDGKREVPFPGSEIGDLI